uniref:Uncharacterized protein n=1 Tax=Oryza punctata TaxID=4537 RepID=A0A0E0KPK3_ORYPU
MLNQKSKEELSIDSYLKYLTQQGFILSNNPSHPPVFSFGDDEKAGREVQGDGLSELWANMDEAIEEVMAEDIHSMNATTTEQMVTEAGVEAEANTGLGLAADVLETVAEAEALEAVAEGDVVTIVSPV